MIYTSYFSKLKKLAADSKDCVAITLGGSFWQGDFCPELAPTNRILAWWKSLSKEEQLNPKNQVIYEKLYRRDVLSHLDVHQMYNNLNDKILLCFEKTGAFCHRHIVAKWFKENGYEAEEII